MLEAFYLGLYLLLVSPILIKLGWDNPYGVFFVLFALSIPGIYALVIGAPYLPTKKSLVRKMVKIAKIKKTDKVVDLGCGDGRIVFEASKKAKLSTGYELSIPVYVWAKVKSFFIPRSKIKYKDFWKQDYTDTNVIFCFLLVQSMKKFEKEIWPNLASNTKVISNTFKLPNIKPAYDKDGIKMYIKP